MIRGFFRFIFSTFFWICAVIGFCIFGLIFFLYLGKVGPFSPTSKPLKQDTVLSLTLNGTYVEYAETKGIESLFLGKNASLYDLTQAILHAAQDSKIKGLMIRIESPHLGTAQLQELREALLTFRKTGKPTWCFAETFGETSSGTGIYYLATACKEVWLQPMGTVNLMGINVELPFAKGAFEKLDIKPEFAQRKEYKSFVEMYTREDFSEANREASQAIADSILSQLVDGIAKERALSHDQVRYLINNGPYLAQDALREKLVDRIDSRQNLIPIIREKLGQRVHFISAGSYLQSFLHETKRDKVALIFGSGIIQRDGGNSTFGDLVMSANSIYKALQLAANDKNVKAIVFRVNSSGGSPVASETIYSIINTVKEKTQKPVIISMSDAAASGGYWISLPGSKIVAQPATLTGSIGVFGGKFVLSGLCEKLGIKFGHVTTSENATLWSFVESFTPAQWVKLNALMDDVYESFTSRVAKERQMTREQVEKVARGRVWTGEQALALGLVDRLGGLQTAIDLAKKEVGLSPDAGVEVYPQPKTVFETLTSLLESEEEDSMPEYGILGAFLQPFKKILSIFTLLFSSQEMVYVPLGDVKS